MTREKESNKTSGTESRRRFNPITFVVATGVLLASLGLIASVALWPAAVEFYTDGAEINQPAEQAKIRDILWQEPKLLEVPLADGTDVYEPSVSADGRKLYWVRGKPGNNADIYEADRTPDGWHNARALEAVNTDADELGPNISADGTLLFFYSDRDGGFGGYDIWVARKGESGWMEPINAGPEVNSAYNDYGPAFAPDGSALYFSSNRPQADDEIRRDPAAWPGTIREDLFKRTYDLYVSSYGEYGPGPAEPLHLLNTPYNEGTPAISPVGDFLYFSSDRPGYSGGFDLYRSRRLAGALNEPGNLGEPVNTPGNELDPSLAMGGYALHFSSDASGEGDGSPYRLLRTESREVFLDYEQQAGPSWAALWSAIWPSLLWALLALLLMLLLLALYSKASQSRPFSLLMRCLIASAALHLLLLLLFNLWRVTAGLAGEFREGKSIQVSLVSQSLGQGIVEQIRGEITRVESPITPEVEQWQEPLHASVPSPSFDPPVAPMTVAHLKTIELRPVDATPATELQPPIKLSQQSTRSVREIAVPDVPVPQQAQAEATNASVVEDLGAVMTAPAKPLHIDVLQKEFDVRVSPTQIAMVEPTSMEVNAPDARPVVESSLEMPRSALPRVADQNVSLPQSPHPMAHEREADHRSQSTLPASPTTPPAMQPKTEFTMQDTEVPAVSTPAEAAFAFESSTPSDASSPMQLSQFSKPKPARAAGQLELSVPEAATNVASSEPDAHIGTQELPMPQAPNLSGVKHDTQLAHADVKPMTVTESARAPDLRHVRESRVQDTPLPKTGKLPALAMTDMALPKAAKSARPSERAGHDPVLPRGRTPAPMIGSAVKPAPIELMPTRNRDLTGKLDGEPLAPKLEPADAQPARRGPTLALNLIPSLPDPALDLKLPADLPPPPDPQRPSEPFAQRSEDERRAWVEARGGSDATEEAVARALKWLAAHQSPDGHWDGERFDNWCGQCGGTTAVEVDTALTGLSLLCFLAADHTHTKDGPYRQNVERAVRWLVGQQSADGDLRGGETMYSHGIATIALAEAFAMTKDDSLKEPAQLAVDFIDLARDPRAGGWRYDPGQPGDTSVLGWQMMALKSARLAGLTVSLDSFRSARRWLNHVASKRYPGRYGYQKGQQFTDAMSAEALFVWHVLGADPDDRKMHDAVDVLMSNLPDWNNEPNTYYWYYATLALYQQGGKPWRTWNDALTRTLVENQRRDQRAAGSWDPIGPWADIGGRVYQTALCTLMLEVYYRYLPMLGEDSAVDAIGSIAGRVVDKETREPLSGARVRLDVPDREPLQAVTDAAGQYVLHIPDVPEFFAMTARLGGFVPAAANVSSARILHDTIRVDFALESGNDRVVAMELNPTVHHIGNDRFTGSINSQFQKKSEGRYYRVEFELTEKQAGAEAAGISMLTKGVQCPHHILINGRRLSRGLTDSPGDGSFGEFQVRFDPSVLQAGTNSLEIRNNPCAGDIDDFEFVNIRVHFRF